jgi:ABC-2 type transport system ATP-binding protein
MNTLPAIATDRLVRRFGDLTAVDQISLNVPVGSIYGFLGPNGAGKTTTIRVLLGLLRPDAGEVCLFGQPLRPGGPASRVRRTLLADVGALVEEPSLYPHLSGRENLEVTRRLVGGVGRAEVKRVLQVVRLVDAADRPARGYSTGMRQRLGLGLALLRSPRLLILDEPTNGLDPAGMQEMRALIRRLPAEWGATVFLSSHLLSEVEQVATHIGILQQGRLCFQGPLDDLRLDPHLVLGVDRPELARQALEAGGWPVCGNGGQRLTVAANGPSDAAAINARLVGAGVNVYHLQLEQPTLEDVFMRFTTRP